MAMLAHLRLWRPHRIQRVIASDRRTVRSRRWTASVLSYFHLSLDLGQDRATAMLETCRTQLRPVIMTCTVACVGLLPARVLHGNRITGTTAAGRWLSSAGCCWRRLDPPRASACLILRFSKAQKCRRSPTGKRRLTAARPSLPRTQADDAALACGMAVATGRAALAPPQSAQRSARVWVQIFTAPQRPASSATPSNRWFAPRRRPASAALRSASWNNKTCQNWWTLFGSDQLNALVNEALRSQSGGCIGAGRAAPGDGKHGGPSAVRIFPAFRATSMQAAIATPWACCRRP